MPEDSTSPKSLVDSEELIDRLADEYAARLRKGEKPSVEDYVDRHPELGEEIRQTFRIVAMVEHAEFGRDDFPGRATESIDQVDQPFEELGDYRILREVGRGGMGIVYEAEQKSLGRRVALKVLPNRSLLDARQVQRFRREARAAARLQHPNIVSVHGVGEDNGSHYFAMQFIQGQGLDNVLVELRAVHKLANEPYTVGIDSNSIAESLLSGTFEISEESSRSTPVSGELDRSDTGERSGQSAAQGTALGSTSSLTSASTGSSKSGMYPFYRTVVRIGKQVAEALQYAHSQRVLHRDIKPSNLLLDIHGNVWVTDFGLAKDEGADDLTNSGDLIGTLRYMAPERFQGWSDPRSDVYGLGLTLYELATLRPAFDSTDRGSLIKAVTQDQPPPPRKLDRNIPHDLETIILKAIAKEAGQRYRSAAELAEDLSRFLDGKPILARRTPLAEQMILWCRRNPVVALLSSGMICFLVLVVVLSSWAALRFERIAAERQNALVEKDIALGQVTEAEHTATARLGESLLAQARAGRWGGQVGRGFNGLRALGQAAQIAHDLELGETKIRQLRNEAIACLTLFDLQVEHRWADFPPVSEQIRVAFDSKLERFARLEPIRTGSHQSENDVAIVIRKVADNSVLKRLAGIGYLKRRPYLIFSPDGRLLAGFGIRREQRIVAVWDANSGRKLAEFDSSTQWYATTIGFSPDSNKLAFQNRRGEIAIHDFETNRQQVVLGDRRFSELRCIRFSPDGRKLGIANRTTVEVYEQGEADPRERYSFDFRVKDLAWEPSGDGVAVASNTDVTLIDFKEKQIRRIGRHKSAVSHVFFNSTGDILASTGWDVTTRFWDVRTGESLLRSDHYGIRFSDDDRRIGWGTAGSSVGCWKVASDREFKKLQCPHAFSYRTSIGPDGRLLAVVGFRAVRFFDLPTRKYLGSLQLEQPDFVHISRTGTTLWTSGKSGVVQWPIEIGERTVRIGEPVAIPSIANHTLAGISPDERWLAAVSHSEQNRSQVILRCVDGSRSDRILNHQDCRSVSFNLHGKWLATAGRRGRQVKVWSLEDGELVATLDASSSVEVEFSNDGRWLATGGQDVSVLWETAGWAEVMRFARSSPGEFGAVAFDSRSRLLAVPKDGHSVQVFDIERRKELATLESPHSDPLCGLSFDSTGSALIAAPHHGALQVWDLPAIRRRLFALDLDWSDFPIPADSRPKPLERLEVVRPPGGLPGPTKSARLLQ